MHVGSVPQSDLLQRTNEGCATGKSGTSTRSGGTVAFGSGVAVSVTGVPTVTVTRQGAAARPLRRPQ